ncbi:MAG TPA: carboxylating nicotinate-nucleotide diphosphorylase [Acidimicrobiales bacterium]|nr:carboxylating nicotinate-nucleotide diphosphorylase [Acidimicrobiales bacterium]
MNRPADLESNIFPPDDAISTCVAAALHEDIGPLGDVTASLVPREQITTAVFCAREQGVLAGTMCATEAFRQIEDILMRRGESKRALDITWFATDGDTIVPGFQIGRISGPLRTILTGERTALNFLSHLSGVATDTRKFVDVVSNVNPRCKIRDTRKTTPGLRALEKAAVRAGGGVNHRSDLSQGILVKDNHLTGITIGDAVAQALVKWPGIPIEVECDTVEQVSQTVLSGAPLVLLDNMTPDQVQACAKIAHDAGVMVEVSGGVTLQSAGEYARAGADYISVGRITHSALILDIGLDIES